MAIFHDNIFFTKKVKLQQERNKQANIKRAINIETAWGNLIN